MNDEFLRDIHAGLSKDKKALAPKWLYDAKGSELFEAITRTEDYYVTRTEAEIMDKVYEVLPDMLPERVAIAEFGSGAGIKSRRLIEHLHPSVYVSIDIAEEFLRQSCEALRHRFPDTDVHGVVADFSGEVSLPDAFFAQDARLGFFPGSTIGNFEEGGAETFLAKSRRSLRDDSRFLIGADLVKDESVLRAAYDDHEGITRRFTLNLLTRMLREAGAELDREALDAIAEWNPERERMELGIRANRDTVIAVDGERYVISEGETIHTENSHKYTRESFEAIAARAGWAVEQCWTDKRDWFGVFLLKAA